MSINDGDRLLCGEGSLRLLIGMALNRNPRLSNIAGTKWVQQLTVEGFLNSAKKRSGPSKELRKLFGEWASLNQ